MSIKTAFNDEFKKPIIQELKAEDFHFKHSVFICYTTNLY